MYRHSIAMCVFPTICAWFWASWNGGNSSQPHRNRKISFSAFHKYFFFIHAYISTRTPIHTFEESNFPHRACLPKSIYILKLHSNVERLLFAPAPMYAENLRAIPELLTANLLAHTNYYGDFFPLLLVCHTVLSLAHQWEGTLFKAKEIWKEDTWFRFFFSWLAGNRTALRSQERNVVFNKIIWNCINIFNIDYRVCRNDLTINYCAKANFQYFLIIQRST